jgi:hypothetical protein
MLGAVKLHLNYPHMYLDLAKMVWLTRIDYYYYMYLDVIKAWMLYNATATDRDLARPPTTLTRILTLLPNKQWVCEP